MARLLIWVEICSQVSNAPYPSFPPWKKSNHVLSRPRKKSQCLEFLVHIKAQSFGAPIICCGPWQLLGLHGHMCYQVDKRERLLCSLWDYVCLGLGLTRCLFKIPNQLLKLSWAFDRSTHAHQSDRPLWSSTSLCAPQWSGTRERKGRDLISLREQCYNLWGVKLQPTGEANRLMLPNALSTMPNSLCSVYSYVAKYLSNPRMAPNIIR